MNIVLRKEADGSMQRPARDHSRDARTPETNHRRDEMKTAVFKIWRGDANGGEFVGIYHGNFRGDGGARRRARDSSEASQ